MAQSHSSVFLRVVLVSFLFLQIGLAQETPPTNAQPETAQRPEAPKAAVVSAAQQRELQQAIQNLHAQAGTFFAEAPTIVWDVLPVKIVRDNYGHNVANKYVAIDILIHNNDSTSQLLIQGFSFTTNHVQYVSNDPALVRGTIEKDQMVGFRNRAVQVIKTTGLIATGAEGYVHAASASANFNRGVSIFSDPFEKGIELIFPDTTVRYLANWDNNQVFKNGFVVDPGKEIRGRVFLGLEIVCSHHFPTKPANGEECSQGGFWVGAKYDPNQIKLRLGQIAAVGNSAATVTGQKIPPPAP